MPYYTYLCSIPSRSVFPEHVPETSKLKISIQYIEMETLLQTKGRSANCAPGYVRGLSRVLGNIQASEKNPVGRSLIVNQLKKAYLGAYRILHANAVFVKLDENRDNPAENPTYLVFDDKKPFHKDIQALLRNPSHRVSLEEKFDVAMEICPCGKRLIVATTRPLINQALSAEQKARRL